MSSYQHPRLLKRTRSAFHAQRYGSRSCFLAATMPVADFSALVLGGSWWKNPMWCYMPCEDSGSTAGERWLATRPRWHDYRPMVWLTIRVT